MNRNRDIPRAPGRFGTLMGRFNIYAQNNPRQFGLRTALGVGAFSVFSASLLFGPLLVAEGFGDAARSIEVPLLFVFQWDDTLMTRQHGMDLYDAFGSSEKTMHVNPGGHIGIPPAEAESWKPFWVRHLGQCRPIGEAP